MFWTRADTMSPYGADRKCRDNSLAAAIRSIPEIICSWRAFRRLSGLSQYDSKVWDGWRILSSLWSPIPLLELFSIFAEHGPETGTSFGDVPLTNHFEAEFEV